MQLIHVLRFLLSKILLASVQTKHYCYLRHFSCVHVYVYGYAVLFSTARNNTLHTVRRQYKKAGNVFTLIKSYTLTTRVHQLKLPDPPF